MIELDATRSALVLVDLMKRIVDLPLEPRPGSEVVERAKALATAFREAGGTVAVVRVERPKVDEQPIGSELVEDVANANDILIVKRAISAFHRTRLHERLQERGIETLVFAGIATNMGVESTAREANDFGYRLVFVDDAMSALTAEEHETAVRYSFPRFGEVVASADVRLR
jgi:nicotinamidase-related amidase